MTNLWQQDYKWLCEPICEYDPLEKILYVLCIKDPVLDPIYN